MLLVNLSYLVFCLLMETYLLCAPAVMTFQWAGPLGMTIQ